MTAMISVITKPKQAQKIGRITIPQVPKMAPNMPLGPSPPAKAPNIAAREKRMPANRPITPLRAAPIFAHERGPTRLMVMAHRVTLSETYTFGAGAGRRGGMGVRNLIVSGVLCALMLADGVAFAQSPLSGNWLPMRQHEDD